MCHLNQFPLSSQPKVLSQSKETVVHVIFFEYWPRNIWLEASKCLPSPSSVRSSKRKRKSNSNIEGRGVKGSSSGASRRGNGQSKEQSIVLPPRTDILAKAVPKISQQGNFRANAACGVSVDIFRATRH